MDQLWLEHILQQSLLKDELAAVSRRDAVGLPRASGPVNDHAATGGDPRYSSVIPKYAAGVLDAVSPPAPKDVNDPEVLEVAQMVLGGLPAGAGSAAGRVAAGSGGGAQMMLRLREPDRLSIERVSTWLPEKVAALKRHYTGSAGPPPGKKIGYRIVEGDQVRGYAGYGEPSFKLGARRMVGRDPADRSGTVNNYMFRLENDGTHKASEILRELEARVAHDWRAQYGWEPQHWETMIDPDAVMSDVVGGSYRKAGYRRLGPTSGLSFRRPTGRGSGPRLEVPGTQKQVFYRGPFDRVPRQQRDDFAEMMNELYRSKMEQWHKRYPGLSAALPDDEAFRKAVVDLILKGGPR